MNAELQAAWVEAMLAFNLALLLVLALRLPLRRWLGARVAYAAWSLPPAALLASLLPAPERAGEAQWLAPVANVGPIAADAVSSVAGGSEWNGLALVWMLGVVALIATLLLRQRRFVERIRPLLPHGERSYLSAGVAGPLLVGHWRPYIVLPLDFEQRYPSEQRALMLDHERAHLAAGDAPASAGAAFLACLVWFNPVAWWALRAFHFDQELACDARVLEARPQARRAYADAMLQAQLAEQRATAPLGCHWPAGHPLKERIRMLTRNLPNPARRRRGLWLIAVVALLLSLGVWAAQPERVAAATDAARYYSVRMLLARPGQPPQMPRLIVREGELAGVRSDDFEIDIRIRGGADQRVWIASDVRIAGAAAGSPALLVDAGTPGSISVADEPGRAYDVTASSERLADVRTPPRYPPAALADRIEGEVVLDLDVDAGGVVRDVAVVRSTPPGTFDAAAIAAARTWWLNPANQPPGSLPGRMRAPVRFELAAEAAPEG